MQRILDLIRIPFYKFALINQTMSSQGLILLLNYYTFNKTYNFLKKSQWWSKEELQYYQFKKLRELITHAYNNVPYYKKIFDKNNITPNDIHKLEDLQKIPFITKELIRENINDLKASNYPDYKFKYITTSGTSGIPLGLYEELGLSDAIIYAFIKVHMDRVGCKFKDKFITLRGDVISSSSKGKFWKSSLFGRIMYLSSYHLNDKYLPKYIEKIRKFKPKFISAYPSSITFIAKYMKKNSIKPFPSVKAIICGAENLYDWQSELIKETFKCKIQTFYGHFEQVAFAGSCEKSNYYHISPEYGIVEIIGKDGKPVKNDNESGEIVATGFTNPIFPLIRYRTGDIGIYSSHKCSCGRNYPLLKKIEGRLQEFVISKNNRFISISSLNIHSDIFDNVKQFQYFQEEKGIVTLKIVKKPYYTEIDTEKIKKGLFEKIGDDFELNIQFVDDIPRTSEGKYLFLIQKIPIQLKDISS